MSAILSTKGREGTTSTKRRRKNCQKNDDYNKEVQQNTGKTNMNEGENKNLHNNGGDKWSRSSSTT